MPSMEDTEPAAPVRKASTAKTVLFTVLILLALVLIGWGLHNLSDPDDFSGPDKNPAKEQRTDASPDPVKTDTGANGDTNASPSGTGPGSSNSLLGPH
jgi:hypothetical protein